MIEDDTSRIEFPVEMDTANISLEGEGEVSLRSLLFIQSNLSPSQATRAPSRSSKTMYSFQIKAEDVEPVRKRCIEMDYPLLEEYDYKRDIRLQNVKMDLKASTRLRAYQEKCLSKMFSHGRARSGIIALPCGAGKSLVGITAASV